MKSKTKSNWAHYSEEDPHFWRDGDGTTTLCGKTARRISHTNHVAEVSCPRCQKIIKENLESGKYILIDSKLVT